MGDLGKHDVIYARQSQDRTRSQDEQEAAGRARSATDGRAIFGVYRDGVSASRHSARARPDWARLLADLERPEVGRLWLWESSRGDRTLETWAAMLTRCRENGVQIHVETHGRTYDVANPRDWRTLAEDGVDSAYESEKTSQRARRAMAANAAAGGVHGICPYGYQREYGLVGGKRVLRGQVENPSEAAIVREIFARIGRGHSLRSIAGDLNEREIPTPTGAPWSPTRCREIALSLTYAGKRQHNPARRGGARHAPGGTVVDAVWPALVEPEQFYAVRELLTEPKRRNARPGRTKHLLSMIAVCALCEGPLSVRYAKNARNAEARRDAEYICRNGSHVRIVQAGLDDLVERVVRARIARDDAYAALVDTDDDGAIQTARNELAEAKAHHASMVSLMAARKLSAVAFADAEPPVLADIAEAERRVAELSAPPALRMLLGDPADDVRARWQAAPVVARRQVVRLLFARIAVNRHTAPGQRIFDPSRVEIEWRQ